MGTLNLRLAEKRRDELTQQQQKKIEKLYADLATKINKELKGLSTSTASGALRKLQLEDLKSEIKKSLTSIRSEIKGMVEGSVRAEAKSVVDSNKDFLNKVGINTKGLFANVQDDVVRSVLFGEVYDGDWTLSSALWLQQKRTQSDVSKIVATGIAENRSAYDIAKDLEKYVDPKAKKDWAWSKVYPGTAKRVDYNAQRLARTLVSHAYQQSLVKTVSSNPFVSGIKWKSAHNSGVCPICRERNGRVYQPGDLPLDHPNGKCTFFAVIPDSMEDIADQLADWAKGKPNEGIDKWFKDMYPDIPVGESKSKLATDSHKVVNGKTDAVKTWKRRKDAFDFEIEDIINYQGFDGLPRVVSTTEFDSLVKESKFIAQRTYSAESKEILDAYREQLYRGKWYVDCSAGGAQYGQGMYCAADWGGNLTEGIKEEMEHYIELNRSRLKREATDEEKLNYAINWVKKNMPEDQVADAVKYIKYDFTGEGNFEDIKAAINRIGGNVTRKKINSGAIGPARELVIEPVSYTETFTLDKTAKVITYSELDSIRGYSSLSKEIIDRSGLSSTNKRKLLDWVDSEESWETADDSVKQLAKDIEARVDELMNLDLGSLAASLGYDAINAEGHGASESYTVILNRTKLIIKKD